jgi:DNA-directed RNA polymerase subunit RPC12/RpoP
MTDKEVDTLPDDPAQLKEMLKDSCHEIERLKYRLALLQRAQFGTRSERVAEEQPTLFDLGSEDVAEVEEPAAEKQQPPLPKRSGHGRRRLPAELERTRIEHELPESQRACPDCGGQRVVIGWQTSEQVEYEPAKLYVIEHARAKYACSHCQEQVAVASKPAQPIEKGLAAP